MKFTLSWLKDYLETDADLQTLCDRLTDIGLELEDLTDPSETYAPFTVAKVLEAKPHPDADKLQILTVQSKDQDAIQVVCGAPNARAGMMGIFAPDGSYVPGLDVTLKKTKIRGVESNGMMVSEREMCLSDEHEGIIDLTDKNYDLGTPMADIYGLNDPVIEIGLTPNRADCAGIYGIARDLAAAGLGTLKPLPKDSFQNAGPSTLKISITDKAGCPHFTAREIKNVKNGPSPDWLQHRLKAIGLRPISALVDITNYFTHGMARPLHVYDAAKLKGPMTIAQTKGGEELDALNDKSYTLQTGATAICDESGVIGLGGIVGGTSTGCDENTVNIILESAYFTPETIARTGRDHGIITDARYRFERGIDPELTAPASNLAAQMIMDLCGTDQTQIYDIVQDGAPISWQREIQYNPAMMQSLIGVNTPESQQQEILEKLGFLIKIAAPDQWMITPPSWRGDIMGAPDITEEIIRIIGLDNIPPQSVKTDDVVPSSAETPLLDKTRKSRNILSIRGLNECVTWSFVSEKTAINFGLNDAAQREMLRLQNAISNDLTIMRPSILPNLIEAAAKNAANGYGNAALYEIGPVFAGSAPKDQSIQIAGLRAGAQGDRHWSGADAARENDFYDVKADVFETLGMLGIPAENAQISRNAPDYFHPGRKGAISLGKNVIAYFGEIHPSILEDMGIKSRACGFEILLENLPASRKKSTSKSYLTLEPLQPLRRDFAFLVDQNVAANDILRAAKSASKKLITDAEIFDIYTGKGVEEGKKSIALSVTLQPKDKTLTDEDLETLSSDVIHAVSSKTGASLR